MASETSGGDDITSDRGLRDVAPLPGFSAAAEVVLELLQTEIDLDLWLVTQKRGNDQVTVAVRGDWLAVPTGAVFPWVESFCRHMVAGTAPRIAPRCADIPAYAGPVFNSEVRIGAYIGVPLVDWEGRLFGTVCGVSARPRGEDLHKGRPLLETTGRLLSTLLAKEQLAADRSRAAAEAYALSDRDAVTGVHNARGWDGALAMEQQRQVREGRPVTMVAVSLPTELAAADDGGEGRQLQRATQAVLEACRPYDRLARLGDTLAVLIVGCPPYDGACTAHRLERGLDRSGVAAEIRWVTCPPGTDLSVTWALCQHSPQPPRALPEERAPTGPWMSVPALLALRTESLRLLAGAGLRRQDLVELTVGDVETAEVLTLVTLPYDVDRRGRLALNSRGLAGGLPAYRDALVHRLTEQPRHPSAPSVMASPLFPVVTATGYVTPVRLSERSVARALQESILPESTVPESILPESTVPESTVTESTVTESIAEPESIAVPEGARADQDDRPAALDRLDACQASTRTSGAGSTTSPLPPQCEQGSSRHPG